MELSKLNPFRKKKRIKKWQIILAIIMASFLLLLFFYLKGRSYFVLNVQTFEGSDNQMVELVKYESGLAMGGYIVAASKQDCVELPSSTFIFKGSMSEVRCDNEELFVLKRSKRRSVIVEEWFVDEDGYQLVDDGVYEVAY